MNPKALDLFCCAGGAARGMQLAGYHVTGVDSRPQPRYCGDAFLQDDAMAWLNGKRDPLSSFDLIWASPPCQRYSQLTPKDRRSEHPDLLPEVLNILRNQNIPYIVENVDGTQIYMRNPIMLCGTMFGLNIWRHRWFEVGNIGSYFFLTPPCAHDGHPILVSGRGMLGVARGMKRSSGTSVATRATAIGIDWMVGKELDQAIPPVYARFIAEHVRTRNDYTTRSF